MIDPWVELCLTQLVLTARHGGPDPHVVTFLGFDNSYFYAVLLPGIAIALGREELLPAGFVTNFFLHLDGSKFSTSRNHVIWADDVLARSSADAVRVVALRHAPELGVRSISRAEAADLGADPLLTALHGWHALLTAAGPEPVPEIGAWTVAHREFYRELSLAAGRADALLSAATFTGAGYLDLLTGLIRTAVAFHLAELPDRPIVTRAEERRTSVALDYLALRAFAALAWPVLPGYAGALWRALGLSGTPRREVMWPPVPSGPIRLPDPPF